MQSPYQHVKSAIGYSRISITVVSDLMGLKDEFKLSAKRPHPFAWQAIVRYVKQSPYAKDPSKIGRVRRFPSRLREYRSPEWKQIKGFLDDIPDEKLMDFAIKEKTIYTDDKLGFRLDLQGVSSPPASRVRKCGELTYRQFPETIIDVMILS